MVYVSKEEGFITFKSRLSLLGIKLDSSNNQWYGSKYRYLAVCANDHYLYVWPSSIYRHIKRYPSTIFCNKCLNIQLFQVFKDRLEGYNVYLHESETCWRGAIQRYQAYCPQDHYCYPSPAQISKGKGPCDKCRMLHVKNLSMHQFISFLSTINATPAWDIWYGSSFKHKVICVNGHICYPIPAKNLYSNRKEICIKCSNIHREWDIFYVVRNNTINQFKFGITSNNHKNRINDHKQDGFTELVYLVYGIDAYQLENDIKYILRYNEIYPIKGNEYFQNSVFNFFMNELDNYGLDNIVNDV